MMGPLILLLWQLPFNPTFWEMTASLQIFTTEYVSPMVTRWIPVHVTVG